MALGLTRARASGRLPTDAFVLKPTLKKIRQFLNSLKELATRLADSDVRYVSAPIWRPWRDF